MKTAIYTRVSTDAQEIEGSSLETQVESCQARANELGYEVPEGLIFRETYSGLALERPLLEQLRELVRNKEVGAVICFCLDRLSRDPVHFILLQDEIERAGAELILVAEDIDNSDLGKLIGYIKGYSAKVEALKIRSRTLEGLKARAKSGLLVGGRSVHLYGYDYVKGKREINETQAGIVRNVFNWLAEGSTIKGIKYHLDEMGILSPQRRSCWNASTVHKILTNTAYIGKPILYHGIEIENSTPAIIDEQLFSQVQKRLKDNGKKASRHAKVKFLLRGYVYCSRCYRKYYACRMHKKTPYYYCCGRLRVVTSNKCENKTYKGDYLEPLVWKQIEELLTNPDIIMTELERRKSEVNQESLTSEIGSIEKRLADLDRQQEDLLSWALGGFPKETVVKENAKINQYRDSLNSRLSELTAKVGEAKQTELDLVGLKHFCELAQHNLKNFSYEEKRLALEALRIEV